MKLFPAIFTPIVLSIAACQCREIQRIEVDPRRFAIENRTGLIPPSVVDATDRLFETSTRATALRIFGAATNGRVERALIFHSVSGTSLFRNPKEWSEWTLQYPTVFRDEILIILFRHSGSSGIITNLDVPRAKVGVFAPGSQLILAYQSANGSGDPSPRDVQSVTDDFEFVSEDLLRSPFVANLSMHDTHVVLITSIDQSTKVSSILINPDIPNGFAGSRPKDTTLLTAVRKMLAGL